MAFREAVLLRIALRSLPPPTRLLFKTPAVPVEELVCVATKSDPTSGGTADVVGIDNRDDTGVGGSVAAILAAADDAVLTGSFMGSFTCSFIGSFMDSFMRSFMRSFAIEGMATFLFSKGDFPTVFLEGFIDTCSIE